jgi:hypothetical protein
MLRGRRDDQNILTPPFCLWADHVQMYIIAIRMPACGYLKRRLLPCWKLLDRGGLLHLLFRRRETHIFISESSRANVVSVLCISMTRIDCLRAS